MHKAHPRLPAWPVVIFGPREKIRSLMTALSRISHENMSYTPPSARVLPRPGTLGFLQELRDQIVAEHFESGGELLVTNAFHPYLSVRHTLFVLNMPANPIRNPTMWQWMVPKQYSQDVGECFREVVFEEITDMSLMEIMTLVLTPGEDAHVWADVFDFAERCQVDSLFDCIKETGGRATFSNRGDLLALHRVNRVRDQLAARRFPPARNAMPGILQSEDEPDASFFPGTQSSSPSSSHRLFSRKLPIPSLSRDYLEAALSHLQVHLFKTTTTPPSPPPPKINMEKDDDQQEAAERTQDQEQRARDRKKKRKDKERARVKRKNLEKKLEVVAQQVEASAGDGSFDLDKAEARYMLDRAKLWAAETKALEKKYGEAKEAQKANLANSRARLNELLAQAADCDELIRRELGSPSGARPLDGSVASHEEPESEEAAVGKFQESVTFSPVKVSVEKVAEERFEGGKVLEGSTEQDKLSTNLEDSNDAENLEYNPAQNAEESNEPSLFVRQSAPETEVSQSGSDHEGPDGENEALPAITNTQNEQISINKATSQKFPPLKSALPNLQKLGQLIPRNKGRASTEEDFEAKVSDAGPTTDNSAKEICKLDSNSQNSADNTAFGNSVAAGSTGVSIDIGTELQPEIDEKDLDIANAALLRLQTQSMSSASGCSGRRESNAQDEMREQDVSRSEFLGSEHVAVEEETSTPPIALDAMTHTQVPVLDTHDPPACQVPLRPVVRLPPTTTNFAPGEPKTNFQPTGPFGGPHGHDHGAQGGLEHTFPPRGSQLPPHHLQRLDPGWPIRLQHLAADNHNRLLGNHETGRPVQNWLHSSHGQGQTYPGVHGSYNFGRPPASGPTHKWQGPFMPPLQLQPFKFVNLGPEMFGAPTPATWQAAAAVPQFLPTIANAPEPRAYPPQVQPFLPQEFGNMRSSAEVSSTSNPMGPAYPQAQQDFGAAAATHDETRASRPGLSTPLWLSQDIYPANATVTFKPKGRNEHLNGLLSSTINGVEFDVPAAWLRRLLDDDESSWEVEQVTVRRRQE